MFAVEAGVEDVVDAAEEVADAAEEADEAAEAAEAVDEAAELLLLPLPASAAPTGRIKPPSTPGGDVLEPELAAAAL